MRIPGQLQTDAYAVLHRRTELLTSKAFFRAGRRLFATSSAARASSTASLRVRNQNKNANLSLLVSTRGFNPYCSGPGDKLN
jgi:hypothetical protein